MNWVYPRVCGGTAVSIDDKTAVLGLSPRVRGNHDKAEYLPGATGSIPACAGEPRPQRGRLSYQQVYPRVCGGTTQLGRSMASEYGLSPRVRGNLQNVKADGIVAGSIPACAGEPGAVSYSTDQCRVYPRVCGGTATRRIIGADRPGLSPRVRGNLRGLRPVPRHRGSIPACAGEPCRASWKRMRTAVYPRVCGGTRYLRRLYARIGGLSPRVRGNLFHVYASQISVRSIPACAGEPIKPSSTSTRRPVYPRVCGGTYREPPCVHRATGLSPRVRGNRYREPAHQQFTRSIPACAGEPKHRPRCNVHCWVYPRVCGGTWPGKTRSVHAAGLSPRVRGNLMCGRG